MSATKFKLPHDIPRTLDLRSAPNLFQASAIGLLSCVGAIVGYRAVDVGQWIAAAVGAIVGLIVATFISGLILMFMASQAVPTITIDQWMAKFHAWRRRLRLTTSVCLCWIGIGFAWYYLKLPTSTWLIASWSVLMVVFYVVPHYYVRCLRLCRCPNCDELFGYRGAFARYPHRCRSCDFTITRQGKITK
jgi:hypothetical protein